MKVFWSGARPDKDAASTTRIRPRRTLAATGPLSETCDRETKGKMGGIPMHDRLVFPKYVEVFE